MKTMSCKQLGGACDKLFSANTFDEILVLSQSHGKEKLEDGDEKHLKAMAKINELMKDSNKMQSWFDNKVKKFESLPED
jgi:hypothetical protein